MCEELVDKLSKKLQKQTKSMKTKRSKEGTFHVVFCEEMETLVFNFKTKDMDKKENKNCSHYLKKIKY